MKKLKQLSEDLRSQCRTSFAKVAKELVPAVQNAAQDAPEEETDEDGEPRSFRFDPAAFNPLREDEELEEEEEEESLMMVMVKMKSAIT